MRVAIVTNFYPPIQTGSCFWAQNLAKAHAKAGDEVVVVTAGLERKCTMTEEGKVTLYRLPRVFTLPQLGIFMNFNQFHLLRSAANIDRLTGILKEHRVQIIHQSSHLLDSMFMTLKVCSKLDLPSVCTIQSIIGHNGNQWIDFGMKSFDRLVLGPLAMNRFNAIINVDKTAEAYVAKTYKPRRTALIPLCSLTHDSWQALKPAEPGKPAEDGAFHLASIGHVTPNRNREELVHALPELVRRGVNPLLMIVGKEMTPIPRQLAQSLGISSRVEFLGEVKQDRLFELLRNVHAEAHLFFIPGLGLATMEAMALGLPVVAYGYEGMYGEVPFRHGVNIMFASPYDQKSVNEALILLAENPNLRQAMGKNARELIRDHLTWDVVIEKFRGLYRELV